MNEKRETVKRQILEAAHQHFTQYGFKKANLVEIADQCHMSAANLYRYFKNKDEIGAAVVLLHLESAEERIEECLRSTGNAKERLASYALKTLEYNHRIYTNHAHMFELIEFISEKRPDLPKRHVALQLSLLEQLMSQGQTQGLIRAGEPKRQAELCFQALRYYLLPHALIMGAPPLPKLTKDLKDLIDLMFEGLGLH